MANQRHGDKSGSINRRASVMAYDFTSLFAALYVDSRRIVGVFYNKGIRIRYLSYGERREIN